MKLSAQNNKTKKDGGYWFFIIFGLCFLLPGLFAASLQIRMVGKSIQASNWQSVPAVTIESELKRSSGSEGGTTYRATGLYEYQWQGDTYSSDQLFYSPGYDSDGKFHRGIIRKLDRGKRANSGFEVKVNPRRPGQSVAFPDIRWKFMAFMSVFSLVFSGAGAGIMAMGHYGQKSIEREGGRADLYPNEPWRWRDIWQTSKISNDSKSGFIGIAVFTLFWNLISWPTAFLILEPIREGEYWIAIFLFFPVIGLFMGRLMLKAYLQWRRFGKSYFDIETMPAAPGHYLMGTLHVPGQPPSDVEFEVKLSCIRKEEQGSGDDRRTVENILWQDEQLIPASAGHYSADFALPVRFALPSDCQTSSIDHTADRAILWRISVEAEAGKVEFDQNYEVPVFDPEEYSFSVSAAALNDGSNAKAVFSYEGDWRKTGVVHTENPEGGYYYFPPARHKGMAFMATIMALIFGGVGVAPFFSDMPLFFGIIFGFFACVILFAWTLPMWLFKSAIDVRPGELVLRRGLFAGKIEQVSAEDVELLEMKSNMSSGEVKYYDIIARLKTGKKLKLAEHLLGKRDVENLMVRIKGELGLPV